MQPFFFTKKESRLEADSLFWEKISGAQISSIRRQIRRCRIRRRRAEAG